ncbi:MAG UNVERIFIED_CONTAM: FG-GAP repeat protein [Planctomycetaceae bacterium]
MEVRLLALAVATLLLLPGCSRTPSESTGSIDQERRREPQTVAPATESTTAFSFRPLPPAILPDVIPDNGARHGFATILESLGSGLAVLDIDHDGHEDLLIAGGGDLQERRITGLPLRALQSRARTFRNHRPCRTGSLCPLQPRPGGE